MSKQAKELPKQSRLARWQRFNTLGQDQDDADGYDKSDDNDNDDNDDKDHDSKDDNEDNNKDDNQVNNQDDDKEDNTMRTSRRMAPASWTSAMLTRKARRKEATVKIILARSHVPLRTLLT